MSAEFPDQNAARDVEQALRDSEERLRIAKEAAALGIYDYDVQTGSIRWDERVRELWGVPPDEPVTYETFLAGLHPDDVESTQQAVDRSLVPSGTGRYEADYRVIHRSDGNTRWIAATGQVTFSDGRPVRMVGSVRDITSQKMVERELQEWSRRLEERVAERAAVAEKRAESLRNIGSQITHAEQRARKHVAKTIHDDLQQVLVAAQMRLPVDRESATDHELVKVNELLTTAVRMARNLVSELSPQVLQDGTFPELCAWLGRLMRERHRLEVEVECEGELDDVPIDVKTVIYEVARELLFNVVKHSGGSNALIRANRNDESLVIRVEDYGCGFDPKEVLRQKGRFGLVGMAERIEAFSGTIDVDSAPNEGTRIIVTMPCHRGNGSGAGQE